MGNLMGKKPSNEASTPALLNNTPAMITNGSPTKKDDQADIRVADVLQKTSKILGKRTRSSRDEAIATSYAFLVPKRRRSTRDGDAIDELEATIKHLVSIGASKRAAEKSLRSRKVRQRIANTLDELKSLTLELEKRDCHSAVKHAEVLEMSVKHMATFVGQSALNNKRESEVDEKVTTTTTTITTTLVDKENGTTRIASCLGELKGLLLEAQQLDATQMIDSAKLEGVDLLEMTVKYLRNNIGKKVNGNNNMCGRVVETSV